MTILGIVYTLNHRVQCVAPGVLPLSDVLYGPAYTDLVLLVTDDETTHTVDLAKLAGDQSFPSNNIEDWDDLEGFITDFDIIEAYITTAVLPPVMMELGTVINGVQSYRVVDLPINNTTPEQLNIVSVENSNHIDVAFCDSKNMDSVLKDAQWYRMPDLLFSKTKAGVVDFNCTIPFVNGAACYPEPWQDKLIAHNARTCLDRNTPYNKNVVLMDFAPYGVLHKYKLSDCTLDRITGMEKSPVTYSPFTDLIFSSMLNCVVASQRTNPTVQMDTSIKLTFITPKCPVSTFPMLCIGGSLFLPSKQLRMTRVHDRYHVSFEITVQQLSKVIAAGLLRLSGDLLSSRLVRPDIVQFVDTLFTARPVAVDNNDWVYNSMTYINSFIPFIAMVQHQPGRSLVVVETEVHTELPEFIKFSQANAGGLLMNKSTCEVIDYVRANYSDNTAAYPVPHKQLRTTAPEYPSLDKPIVGYTANNVANTDAYNPFGGFVDVRAHSNYVLIDIVRRPE